MMNPKTFAGANVFVSRNLVAPEIFDALHDALKLNGAEIFLCCDPSRNGPNDFHIISSADHEKFEDLRAKGCNLLGPQCVLSCAKEHRPLPKQGFTCCLAMDGVKILASGFQADEKAEIVKLVTAMGGVLHMKASLDVSFVIVKNVLAAKYKWALNISKKPIVTFAWLKQCWIEHRVVPQEAYRVLPFSGLTMSVSRIPADERKEIERLILQNGGRYSADLTRKCTHLICKISFSQFFSTAPEGDKYKVARSWGHISIVTRKWFDQSIARRACLNEESYTVDSVSVTSNKMARGFLINQHSQEKVIGNLQTAPSSFATDSNFSAVSGPGFADLDFEATVSQNTSTFSDASHFRKEVDVEVPIEMPKNEACTENCIANDSESEDNDLYLSACRILVVGFEASEMRKIVNMIRRGGGSRYMMFNDKLTHIIVGNPSEMEKKEVREIAASGVIHVVRTIWLEDCERQRKEIPVLARHMANDALIPKVSSKTTFSVMDQNKVSNVYPSMIPNELEGGIHVSIGKPSMMEEKIEEKIEANLTGDRTVKLSQKSLPFVANGTNKSQEKMRRDSTVHNGKSSCVFKGKVFCFSSSFPEDRRAEIVEWITQGGGEVVEDHMKQKVHFTIECHGVTLRCTDVQTTHVSSHWIRSCLEDGCLLDISGHILYSPLPCSIPLSGFQNIRFCVSQYEDKDRILLRNLCFVLGAKFVEKLTKKVTHLICKFSNGPKYDAACKWGIHSIRAEWIYECVRQSKIVSLDLYRPKEVTAQDREAGLCTVSQFPTQAVRMIGGESQSQFSSQSAVRRDQPAGTKSSFIMGEVELLSFSNKKAKLLEDDIQRHPLFSGNSLPHSVCSMNSTRDDTSKCSAVTSHVPDVAAAIEDLLEQTSKIHDQESPGRTDCDKSIFPSGCSIIGQDHSEAHPIIGLSNQWLKRTERKEDTSNPTGDGGAGLYDGFSETQTESQVVGYEEDLSGRQMLIDRVRTRSSMT